MTTPTNKCMTYLLAALACSGAWPAVLQATGPATTAPSTTQAAMEPIVLSGPADADGASGGLVTVRLDFADAPDLRDWAARAGEYAIPWYPQLAALLASDGFEPSRDIRIVFKEMNGIAFRAGNSITISAKWVRERPADLGMVVHELTHIIQDYPSRRDNPGWLVEGIADYVRYYIVEPGSPQARFNPRRQTYTSGYQPAAGFLDWIERTRGPGVIVRLNRAMRSGTYTARRFREIAGSEADALWEQYKASLEKQAAINEP